MENYYLVKVIKPFGIYGVGAELTMREKFVNGLYKDKIEEIKKLSKKELAKYNPQIKYKVETTEKEGAEKTITEDPKTGETETETPATEVETTETTEVAGNVIGQDGEPETEDETEENKTSETETEVELEELATEELLKLANETYKLNKPSNTGRPNLIASITEARKK